MVDAVQPRDASPSPSQLPPVPGSPTYSFASTANRLSTYNLPLPPPPRPAHAILSKTDLEASQTAYADLLATAKSYRLALAALSAASSAFGSALEACARLKEARAEPIGPSPNAASLVGSFHASAAPCSADPLLSASGVHHLVANHHHILSETVYRSFEVPLLDELDKWRRAMEDEDESYVKTVRDKSREIRRLEKEGLKLHRQRRRDVGRFRAHLVDLTTKLDGLTALHGDHARTLLRESQETSAKIVDATCSLVRAEVDIFESLARKGWTGGGLDDLLERGQDLFATTDLPDDYVSAAAGGVASNGSSSKLFSILPPRSILADAGSDASRPLGHTRSDSLLVDDAERYQSLVGAAVASGPSPGGDAEDAETRSVSSDSGRKNRPRGARPFSPQPIRRNPTDVPFNDTLGEPAVTPDAAADQEIKADDEDEGGEGEEREEPTNAVQVLGDAGELKMKQNGDGREEDDLEHQPWRNEGKGQLRDSDTNEEDEPARENVTRGNASGEALQQAKQGNDEERGRSRERDLSEDGPA
ncbi:hypothetical protein SODALDRAFT_330676 [Sodiomyces alkalinus F11]|uniref:Phospholipid-binding protein n=1 Tax=Sodiomyces alkalinus (strain CBS 110278 / VKM F-3762 / F11) TaxID=1314773 RepID=A0A3N2Q2K5_SODAK|nr:hypothetical protein SODALDRAFT_330676 [Sodiomyces alkalinus F11]ROT40956.1 hypothetical protein SODALDRAFT_330676 [Sodiomyces alkalinus F11]